MNNNNISQYVGLGYFFPQTVVPLCLYSVFYFLVGVALYPLYPFFFGLYMGSHNILLMNLLPCDVSFFFVTMTSLFLLLSSWLFVLFLYALFLCFGDFILIIRDAFQGWEV